MCNGCQHYFELVVFVASSVILTARGSNHKFTRVHPTRVFLLDLGCIEHKMQFHLLVVLDIVLGIVFGIVFLVVLVLLWICHVSQPVH